MERERLNAAIGQLMEAYDISAVRSRASALYKGYREGCFTIADTLGSVAYAGLRMPATYGAITRAMVLAKQHLPEFVPRSLLDVGAGTGTGFWAALHAFPSVTGGVMLERNPYMQEVGERLSQLTEQDNTLEWIRGDVLETPLPTADLVVCAYVLGELEETQALRAVTKMWDATNQVLLLAEPGTPEGFGRMQAYVRLLKERGGTMAAPCPSMCPCPLEEDYCHFIARIERTSFMRQAKAATKPYEEEAFLFAAIAKERTLTEKMEQSRVIRRPAKSKGRVSIRLCSCDGVQEKSITKKSALYKTARKIKWGELIKDSHEY